MSPTLSPEVQGKPIMPGLVEGYDYVGYGSCRDGSDEPYPTVSQLYMPTAESCGDFCDKFHISIVNGIVGKVRGFTWTDANVLSQTCYCVFDSRTDVEVLAKILGGGREHEGSWVPTDSLSEGDGIGPVASVSGSNHSYCYSKSESFETRHESICLQEGEYQFTVYDSAGNGICCVWGQGSYNVTSYGEIIKEGGDFVSSESTLFSIPFVAP